MKKVIICSIILLGLCACGKQDPFNNPDINNVKTSLESINDIEEICVVTEDNDPNGKLNKQGGYTGALFFTYSKVEDAYKDGTDACDVGTVGGGSIEVFANEEDAQSRDDYHSNFDGGIFASFHKKQGTVVIRISDELTATQQEELYNQIIEVMQN